MFTKARRFEQLLEKVTDFAIIFKNTEGIIEEWNVGAERLFGYTAEEAIGQSILIIYTPEDRANQISSLEMKTAAETGVSEDERWHLRKDGSVFFASGLLHSIYEEGVLTCYVKIVRDLTERIQFAEQLQEAKDNVEVRVGERTGELQELNNSLRVEVVNRKQSEQLRVNLLRKIVRTQEDERKRIARDIHDHIGQQMTGLQLKLQLLLDKCEKDSELIEEVTKVKSIADQIDSDVDFLAWELRPTVLDDLGLSAAMQKFVKDWSKQFGIPAEFNQIGLDGKHLLPEIEINLYRIGQEALNNTSKYAKASNASVSLQRRDGTISLIIEDDGIGFDVSKYEKMTEDDRGMGLYGMKERAELVGGSLEIESSSGNGTTIYARVPAQFEETA
jgi:PAS domain S-box-containing protein